MNIAIFSAFKRELKYILKNVRVRTELNKGPVKIFIAEYGPHEIMAVQTGMGIHNAGHAVTDVLREFNPGMIISVGYGGALYEGAAIGDMIVAERCFMIPQIDGVALRNSNNGEMVRKIKDVKDVYEGDILTIGRWMSKQEIMKVMPEELRCPVCDMETFPIARHSLDMGLPFIAVRSITDRIDEEIPSEFCGLTDDSGNYRLLYALRLLLSKPRLLQDMVRLGRNSEKASQNLWHAVKAVLERD